MMEKITELEKKLLYWLKVSVDGTEESVWRRIVVSGDTVLSQLHHVLRQVFDGPMTDTYVFFLKGFAFSSQAPLFVGFDEDGKAPRKLNGENIRLHAILDVGDRLTYQSGKENKGQYAILVEQEYTTGEALPLPYCLDGQGTLPASLLGEAADVVASAPGKQRTTSTENRSSWTYSAEDINCRIHGKVVVLTQKEADILTRVTEKHRKKEAIVWKDGGVDVSQTSVESKEWDSVELTPPMSEWGELYRQAQSLRKDAVWKKIENGSILQLSVPGLDEPVFSVRTQMREGREAISFYQGCLAIEEYMRFCSVPPDASPTMTQHMRDCIVCVFGHPSDLTEADITIYRYLNMDEQASHAIYFRRLEPGYWPWMLQGTDIQKGERMLAAFRKLFSRYQQEPVLIGEGKALAEAENGWRFVDLTAINERLTPMIWRNEVKMNKLSKIGLVHRSVTLSIHYREHEQFEKHSRKRPACKKILCLTDLEDVSWSKYLIVDEKDSVADCLYTLLGSLYARRWGGLPERIYVPDKRNLWYVENLCQRLGILALVSQHPYFVAAPSLHWCGKRSQQTNPYHLLE